MPILLVSDRGGALRIYAIDQEDGAAHLIGSPSAADPSYQDSMPARLPDGRIVFVSDRDGNPEIYLASPDGGAVARLTGEPRGPGRAIRASDPTPLGRDRIVFARTEAGTPEASPRDLYVARTDGSEMRRLTRHPADDGAPAGSPDGRSVVFASDRSGNRRLELIPDVDAADPDATVVDLSRAAPPGPGDAGRPFADGAPAFLPDGSLVFSRGFGSDPPQIFLMGAAGARLGLRQVTESLVLPYGAYEPVALGQDAVLFTTCLTVEAPGGGKAERSLAYRIGIGGFNLAKVTRDQAHYNDFSRRLSPCR
ncbi:MAG TPA: hypothetical protein VJ144_07410 [Candidatus Polarisedimenticolia bacterium]|nr:hypothetical protein [Candidatus Polarisedimenticolia bacterium]